MRIWLQQKNLSEDFGGNNTIPQKRISHRDGYWVVLAKEVSDLPSPKCRKTDFK